MIKVKFNFTTSNIVWHDLVDLEKICNNQVVKIPPSVLDTNAISVIEHSILKSDEVIVEMLVYFAKEEELKKFCNWILRFTVQENFKLARTTDNYMEIFIIDGKLVYHTKDKCYKCANFNRTNGIESCMLCNVSLNCEDWEDFGEKSIYDDISISEIVQVMKYSRLIADQTVCEEDRYSNNIAENHENRVNKIANAIYCNELEKLKNISNKVKETYMKKYL